jgi:F-type H+-transporting ATPase subunit a
MSFEEKLIEEMKSSVLFHIKVGGLDIPVADCIVVMWFVMVVIIAFAIFMTRRLERVPRGKQNLIEFLVEKINDTVKGLLGHHWKPYAPWLGTIFIFLLFANLTSVFDIFSFIVVGHDAEGKNVMFHIYQPTKNINVTACMAIMTILLVIFSGLRYKGPVGFIKSFAHPVAIMVPFKIMDYFTRPLSLALRLFGNMFGGFVIMEMLYILVPFFVPAVFGVYFDLFDGVIQAFIFSYLSLVYIGEIIE